MKNKITIGIPTHNSSKTIKETIESALSQEYPAKEILIIDDASTDNTVEIIKQYPQIRLIQNEVNLGIGKNLVKLLDNCSTRYIMYLSSDDLITHPKVVSDIVRIFDKNTEIGIIGRYYYFFMHNCPGAIGTCRDMNILTSSCNPSGMALRKVPGIVASNKIFVEMPSIVAQYLKDWRWTLIPYDTIAARFMPGNNTGTKKEYYTESPWQNWVDLTGDTKWQDFPSFIMLKNRAPKMLWPEIKLALKLNKKILYSSSFWFHAIIAVITPRFILRHITNFYRNKITRIFAKVIERNEA